MITDAIIKQYKTNTQTPWGKMFYRLAHKQINNAIIEFYSQDSCLDIVDFGSGLGITAKYLSQKHHVIAIEPNLKLTLDEQTEEYKPIIGSIDRLQEIKTEAIDFVVCHNVLEYVDQQEMYLNELLRILKKDGVLSLICHNLPGHVMTNGVFLENPEKAYQEFLGKQETENGMFGLFRYLDKDFLTKIIEERGFTIYKDLGIRIIFGLIANNEIKFDAKWDQNMFELEIALADQLPYKEIAFWKHFIIKKAVQSVKE